MNTKQEVVSTLNRRYTVKLTDKQIDHIVELVDVEEQDIEEAIDSVISSGYIDADDINFDE